MRIIYTIDKSVTRLPESNATNSEKTMLNTKRQCTQMFDTDGKNKTAVIVLKKLLISL